MRVPSVLLLLLLLACTKADPSPGQPAASASMAAPVVSAAPPLPTLPTPAPPSSVSALGVCNRIAAKAGGLRCSPTDASNGATFRFGSTAFGGMVMIARNADHYRQALDTMDFGSYQLATSDKALAIVCWEGGGEIVAAEIRLALMQLDAQ